MKVEETPSKRSLFTQEQESVYSYGTKKIKERIKILYNKTDKVAIPFKESIFAAQESKPLERVVEVDESQNSQSLAINRKSVEAIRSHIKNQPSEEVFIPKMNEKIDQIKGQLQMCIQHSQSDTSKSS